MQKNKTFQLLCPVKSSMTNTVAEKKEKRDYKVVKHEDFHRHSMRKTNLVREPSGQKIKG